MNLTWSFSSFARVPSFLSLAQNCSSYSFLVTCRLCSRVDSASPPPSCVSYETLELFCVFAAPQPFACPQKRLWGQAAFRAIWKSKFQQSKAWGFAAQYKKLYPTQNTVSASIESSFLCSQLLLYNNQSSVSSVYQTQFLEILVRWLWTIVIYWMYLGCLPLNQHKETVSLFSQYEHHCALVPHSHFPYLFYIAFEWVHESRTFYAYFFLQHQHFNILHWQ